MPRKELQTIEHQIIRRMVQDLKAAGWELFSAYDGEEQTPVSDTDAALDVFDSVSDSIFWFRGRDARSWVRLIDGNGCDVISDWGVREGFDEALEGVLDWVNANDTRG